jgi:hypothetical protein
MVRACASGAATTAPTASAVNSVMLRCSLRAKIAAGDNYASVREDLVVLRLVRVRERRALSGARVMGLVDNDTGRIGQAVQANLPWYVTRNGWIGPTPGPHPDLNATVFIGRPDLIGM